MVGKKGMKQSGHRSFNYREKRFNELGRQGLLNYFRQTIDPVKVRLNFWEKHDYEISPSEAKLVARAVEKKLWEENKDFTIDMVDTILHFSNVFEITNVESFALVCYLYKAIGEKENPTRKETGDIMDSVLMNANKLRLENWDSFMRILKEVT